MSEMASTPNLDATPLNHLGLFENSPNPYLVLDRKLNIAGANKAYLAAVKRDLADIVGRWAWDAFPTDPETERQAVASFERVIRTKQTDTMALLRFDVPRPNTEGGGFSKRYWSITHTPILDAAGEVSLVLQHPIDVTELETLRESMRVSDEEAAARLEPSQSGIFERARSVFEQNLTLKDERERLERMFANAPSFIALLEGPDHVFRLANKAYGRLVGGRDSIGLSVAEALPDAAAQGFVDLLDTVFRTGKPHSAVGTPFNVQTAPGEPVVERYMDFVYQPIPDANGRTIGIFVEGSDVTERMQAEIALRDSEQFLRSVLSSSNDCIKVLDIDAKLVFMSEGGQRVMEVSDFNEIAGCPWPDFWHGAGNVAAKAAIKSARSGVASSFQGYAETMKGSRRYWDVQVSPILGPDGKPERILSVSRDITALKQAEETRAVLAQELAHRMKNTLAMVQAIVTSTLRNTASITEAAEAITGRLGALSGAQDILTQTSWAAARIEDVVKGVLRPHRPDENRICMAGPAIELSAQQALGLSLTLHELATNAAKYGALSNATGIVDVEWGRPAPGVFTFQWTERGGPPVQAPARKGFGSRLLERIVASYFDGTAKLSYEPEGLTFRLQGKV